jgi:pimeloyl-ACP methyl ester carboxylesterase
MIPLMRELAPEFAVYAPDLPGFGRSEKPKHVPDVAELGLMLREWIEAAGIGRALVAGNSLGCQVLVELANVDARVAAGSVLLGPTMDATTPNELMQIVRLFADPLYEPPLLAPMQALEYLRSGPLRAYRTFRHALRHRMLERASALTMPTVLMRGERDPTVSDRLLGMLAARVPRSTAVVVPGAGHALNYNSPVEVGRHVRSLAARVAEEQA